MTRCGLAERVKGWPPGCGFAGFARLPQGFSGREEKRSVGAAVPLEGGALPVGWRLTG